MLKKLAAVWVLILILFLAPISVVEIQSLEKSDSMYDTSGRDDDDDDDDDDIDALFA